MVVLKMICLVKSTMKKIKEVNGIVRVFLFVSGRLLTAVLSEMEIFEQRYSLCEEEVSHVIMGRRVFRKKTQYMQRA